MSVLLNFTISETFLTTMFSLVNWLIYLGKSRFISEVRIPLKYGSDLLYELYDILFIPTDFKSLIVDINKESAKYLEE